MSAENQFNFFSRLKIRTKLISIISAIIVISLSGMILLATFFFKNDTEARLQENNQKIAEITAQKMQTDFNAIMEKLNLVASAMSRSGGGQQNLFSELFFSGDKSLIYVGIGRRQGDGVRIDQNLHNASFMAENQMSLSDIDEANGVFGKKLSGAFNNEVVVINASKDLKTPVIAMALPFDKGADGLPASIVVAYIRLDRFLDSFKQSGIFQSFMVNGTGDVIAHQDSAIIMSHGNFINLPIVQNMLKSKLDNGQTTYTHSDGKEYLGAFKKIGIASLGIITTVKAETAFKAIYIIQRRNIYITIIVLTLAILVAYFFSKTLSNPITRLLGATKEIEKGNFLVNIVPSSGDEIGELTHSFVAMGRGLEEREKMKEAFGKFVNKEIAEQVLRGEIKLGGERKNATVFFSDIRSFTSISEKLQPEEVVEFLNQYMTRMVNCVNETFGVVDKYIGDAIMAVWGAPVSKGNDTENAINGALMMRHQLIDFNKGRGGDKKPIIKIGCGINTGPVLAGQIGSEDRMEYTVIGDTVNLASRIESLNKPFGTDILISQDTYKLVNAIYNCEPMQKIKVKGKAEPQQIYAVLGRKDDATAPRSLEQLRAMLGIEITGKPEVGEGEEVKYEIIEEHK